MTREAEARLKDEGKPARQGLKRTNAHIAKSWDTESNCPKRNLRERPTRKEAPPRGPTFI